MPDVVTLDDVRAAAARIAPHVRPTPTLSATSLGEPAGVRLWLKAELFQRTGSFKVRGVFNALLSMTPEERWAGLVSISAGNHAAALAHAATTLGTAATIVMPAHAVPSKIAATEAYGGQVVLTDRPLLEVMHEVQEGRALVHPFDDERIVAGTGTVGLEVLDAVPDVDLVVVPVGGGGLIAGVATAVKALRPGVRVVGVEPETADVMARSLAAGSPQSQDRPRSVADGLCAPFAGEHTFAVVRDLVDDVVRVSDEQIVDALKLVYARAKLAVEPAAAAPVAALLADRTGATPGARVVAIASGGNIDAATLKSLL
jgi:threonine dehydratase